MTPTTETSTARTRATRRLCLLLAAPLAGAMLGVAGLAAPANAESTTVNDPAGDHKPAYLDITTVKYNNGNANLTTVIHGVNIRKNQTYVALNIKPLDRSGVTYQVATYGKLGGPGYVRQIYRTNADHTASVRLHCGLKTKTYPALDYVTMTIPQACLGSHEGKVRMMAFLELAYSEGGAGERAPAAVLNQGQPM